MSDDELRWKNEWGGRIYFSHGTHNSCGVAILLKKKLNMKILEIVRDEEQGRFIILKVLYEGQNYTLCNLYAPNEDNPEFFQKVFNLVEQCANDYRVISGDFNLVLNNEKDKRGKAPHAHKNAMEYINSYMQNEELVDIWREGNPELFRFTWHRNESQSRLDFFLISRTLVDHVIKNGIKPAFKSDHSRPYLTISPLKTPRGNGYWKLNNLLLHDVDYCTKVKEIIQNQIEQEYEDSTNMGNDKIKSKRILNTIFNS